MEMNAQAPKLQAAENDLKQLVADVTRAMEKAQEAVASIVSKARSHYRARIHLALQRVFFAERGKRQLTRGHLRDGHCDGHERAMARCPMTVGSVTQAELRLQNPLR
jgi:hypothetical protein